MRFAKCYHSVAACLHRIEACLNMQVIGGVGRNQKTPPVSAYTNVYRDRPFTKIM